MKRIAAHHMTLGGIMYVNHVVELDDNGSIVKHYPLLEELPQTEWMNNYDK
ncbi:MAG: hypothetical protein KBT06_10795 [Prevotellaceae bacterium]|nr:hypothetical protein [Candidatus Colivivens equi]